MSHSSGGDPTDTGLQRIRGVGASTKANRTDAAEATSVSEIGQAQATQEAAQLDPAASVAESLSSGAIDAAAAKAELVAQAVAAQLPPGVDPATIAEVQAEVEALLEADPVLDDLLRP